MEQRRRGDSVDLEARERVARARVWMVEGGMVSEDVFGGFRGRKGGQTYGSKRSGR